MQQPQPRFPNEPLYLQKARQASLRTKPVDRELKRYSTLQEGQGRNGSLQQEYNNASA